MCLHRYYIPYAIPAQTALTQWFRKFFTATPHHDRRPRRRDQVGLALEALEDRLVPTVAFKPFFGNEALNNGHNVLSSSDIYPIFWGQWWGSHMDEVAKLTAAFDNLINRPNAYSTAKTYLSAAIQYGTDGKVTFHDTYHDNYIVDTSSNPPRQVNHGSIGINFSDLSNEIENLIYDAHAVPSPEDLRCDPLYVVITPPNVTSKQSGEHAFNVPGLHHAGDWQWREELWVSTENVNPKGDYDSNNNRLNVDYTTELFSHEVVEAITAPFGAVVPGKEGATVSPGLQWPVYIPGLPPSFGATGDHQMADYEPDGNYFYRVGGAGGSMAQAYWSDALQQFVVPDGNSLVMQLQPNWVGSVPNVWGTEEIYNQLTKHWEPTLVLITQGSTGTLQGGTLIIDANQPGIPGDFVGNQQIVIDTVQMPSGPGVEVTLDGQKFDFEDADFASGRITDIQVNTANDTELISINGTLPNVPVTINLGSGNYTVDLGHYSRNALNGDVTINNARGGGGVVKVDPSVWGTGAVSVNNSKGSLDVQLGPTAHSLQSIGGSVFVSGGGHTSIEVHDELNGQATTYAVTTDLSGVRRLRSSANAAFGLSYIGVPTVSVAGGFGADTYDLSDWIAGTDPQHLSITAGGWPGSNRSSGANTLIVPYASGIGGSADLTFDARGTDLTLDDRGAGAAGTYTVTAGAVTRDAQGRLPLIQASHFKSLTLWTRPDDVVKVQSTQVPTTVIGADGFDQFVVGTGSDLTLDNHISYGASTYTITAGALTRDAHGKAASVTVNYANLQSLTLKTGWGASTVNMESTPAPTTVSGGGGADTFNVGLAAHDMGGINDLLTLDGGPGSASLTVYDQAHRNPYSAVYTVTSTTLRRDEDEPPPKGVVGLPQHKTITVNYTHLSQLELDAADRTSNVVNVESTSIPTWIYGGAGTTQVNVTPTSRNLDNIAGHLNIYGVPGIVTLNDQANPDGRLSGVPTTYSLSDSGLRRTATYRGTTTVLISLNEGYTLNTSTSSSNVVTVSNDLPVTLNAGAADAITVLPRYGGQGQLTVNGHGGTLFVNAAGLQNDAGDVFDMGFTITDNAVAWTEHEHTEELVIVDSSDLDGKHKPPPPKLVATDADFGGLINYANVSALRIDGGAIDSTFTVASTAAGTPVTINASTGDRPETFKPRDQRERATINQFQVGNGTVQNIRSALTLHASGATDTLLVDDSGATTQDIVTVTPTQVGAAATDKFFGSGGSLLYLSVPRLTLNLSNAKDDVINLTPSASTAFTVNGNRTQFQAGHGALLNLNLNGVNTPGKPGDGQWTFGNRQAVTYTALGVPVSNVTSQLAFSYGSFVYDPATKHYKQTVTLTNTSGKPIIGPLSLVLDGLSAGVQLVNASGKTAAGSPYVDVALAGNVLDAGQSVTVVLEFASPSAAINYSARALAGSGPR
jgi:hypothetical protein